MKLTLVRYTTRPEWAQENQHLIERVFQELHEKAPQGLRYAVFRLGLDDFVHLHAVEDGASPVSALEAFKAFQDKIKLRAFERPQVEELGRGSIVGSYRMLSD